MSGHLSDQEISSYRSRSLPPEMLLSANDHLFSCQSCFERFQAGRRPDELVSIDLGGPPASHDVLYDQLEKYVDEEMSPGERTSFELHLDRCAVCREEVADLLELKASMAGSESAGPRGDGRAVPIDATAPASLRTPWYARPISAWAAAAAALLLAMVFSLVVNLSLRNEIAGLREQIKSLEQDNEVAIKQAGSRIEDLTGRLKSLESRKNELPDRGSGPGVGEVKVSLHDRGQVIELDGGSLRGLDSVSAVSRKAVEAALTTSSLHVPPAGALLGKPSALMGPAPDAGSLSVKGPVGVVVEEDRPLFTWSPVAGATSYTVVISSPKSPKLITSGPVDGNSWQATTPLARGAVYSWEVRAILADGRELSAPAPPAPMARFKVVSESEEKGLEEARRLTPQSHLLLGVLYAQAGLAGPARSALGALLDENPGSEVARKLLAALDRARPDGPNKDFH